MDAINSEIRRIASELAVIAATENNVRDEQESIQKSIEDLNVRRTEVNKSLDEKNREIQNYRSGLQRFKDYTTLQSLRFSRELILLMTSSLSSVRRRLLNYRNKKILLFIMQSRNSKRR
jgi:prefoldin subunit 5